MKLDILTKQRIDKWFSEVTPDELLYITQKYLTQDQLQLLQLRVVGRSEQLCGFFEASTKTSLATTCIHCGREKWLHPKAT